MSSVNIVIPVYNEKGNIGRALERIKSEVKCPYKVTIVYDFEGDTSLPEAKEFNQRLNLNLTLQKNIYGRGALNAIRTGLDTSTSEFTIVTMADLSDPPRVINDMLEKAIKDGCEIVCGSRYMTGGAQHGGLTLKSALSRIAGVTLKIFAGLPTYDATNSFKLYSNQILKAIKIESEGGFELGLELVVKAHISGMKIGEVPTIWEDRSAGQSRFQLLKWLPKYLKWYILAFKHKYFYRLVGKSKLA